MSAVFGVRVIKKINRKSPSIVEETLLDTLSAYGVAVYVASGEFLRNVGPMFKFLEL